MRYFYGNTSLDGNAFEYLAEPMKILKGRLIVFAFFMFFSIVMIIYPLIGIVYFFLLLILTPWVIRQALRFRYHYTAWRGVRFSFAGSLWDAAKAFVFWPLSFVLLGVMPLPFWWHSQTHYLVDNAHFGAASFENRSTVGNFIKLLFVIFGSIMLVCLITAIFGGVIVTAIAAFETMEMSRQQLSVVIAVLGMPLSFVIIICCATPFALYKVRMTNLRVGKSTLGPHQLVSAYATGSYLALLVTNTLFVILTLGLFYPFAKVRTARYAAAHTEIITVGDLDGFVTERQSEVSALGGETADFLDIDIGF